MTRYLYDGDNILDEYDGNYNLITKYVHNLGIDDPLSIEKGGATYYYHKDGLGRVVGYVVRTSP